MDNSLLQAWGAGFIEGDGCFDSRQRWRAASTQVDHLDRLTSIFGGTWYQIAVAQPHHKAMGEWQVSTKRHGPDIGTILPGLSTHRREQLIKYGFTLPVAREYTEEEWWAWLAGFMDAEGHVCGTGASLSTNLILVQVASDETLRWAQRIIGSGSINHHDNKWNGSYRYGVYGAKADAALDRLLPFLCSYRTAQIHAHRERQAVRRVKKS